MKSRILYGLSGGVILAVIGLVIGLIIGMNIGGNDDTGFEFMGGVGYEATGYLGAMVGAIIGMFLGVFWGVKIADRMDKTKLQQ